MTAAPSPDLAAAHEAAIEAASFAELDYVLASPRELGPRAPEQAITAYLAGLEAAGFVVVPVVATDEMLDAAGAVAQICNCTVAYVQPADSITTWSAMVAARPRREG